EITIKCVEIAGGARTNISHVEMLSLLQSVARGYLQLAIARLAVVAQQQRPISDWFKDEFAACPPFFDAKAQQEPTDFVIQLERSGDTARIPVATILNYRIKQSWTSKHCRTIGRKRGNH